VSWPAVLFQALASTAIWGLLMTWAFDWPRETIPGPMVVFGVVMLAILAAMKLVRDRKGNR
jgi:hypothetical protein